MTKGDGGWTKGYIVMSEQKIPGGREILVEN